MLGLCFAGLLSGGQARATLGQAVLAHPASDASAPVGKAVAASPAPRAALYTRHQFQLDSGTIVQELATSSGLVFAVIWRGPVLPDLSILMGEHFTRFKQETERARRSGRRGSPASLVSEQLVVSSGGYQRNFSGYAYVPALVPAGLSIRDVLP